ncbi:MAG: SDR family oxidoreductase [Paracoccaceae bacterium]|nr:SDR family oxidoreductase [Paracoccaceae bacterium]
MRLAGQKALVTGSEGGIGRAIVARLRQDGAEVLGTDMSEASDLPGDLTDPSFCDALPGLAEERLGGLDILVNNAGVIPRGRITETSDADYRLAMTVNVEAPFRLCRAAIPIMEAAGGGAIVNTSSCWGVHPGPDHPLYIMSKAAVASLTQCLGRDHARQGIRVNAVCPNEVNTPMIRTGFEIRGLDPDKGIESLNDSVPLGRIAEPEDIADVVAFLVSDDARYMCGALLEVNGGKPVG